jgi:hypothetical protein
VSAPPTPRTGPRCRFNPNLVIFVLLASLSSTACSAVFVNRAKVDDEPNPSCTTNRVAPVLDVLFGVASAGAMIYYATQKGADSRDLLVSSAAGWTGIHVGSAIYGFRNTSECIESKRIGWEPESADPDERARLKKKRAPVRLQPEPGVMRSN